MSIQCPQKEAAKKKENSARRYFSRRYLTNASGKDLARLWRPRSDVI